MEVKGWSERQSEEYDRKIEHEVKRVFELNLIKSTEINSLVCCHEKLIASSTHLQATPPSYSTVVLEHQHVASPGAFTCAFSSREDIKSPLWLWTMALAALTNPPAQRLPIQRELLMPPNPTQVTEGSSTGTAAKTPSSALVVSRQLEALRMREFLVGSLYQLTTLYVFVFISMIFSVRISVIMFYVFNIY